MGATLNWNMPFKTRNGKDVRDLRPTPHSVYAYEGFIGQHRHTWTREGRYYSTKFADCELDLVNVPLDPRVGDTVLVRAIVRKDLSGCVIGLKLAGGDCFAATHSDIASIESRAEPIKVGDRVVDAAGAHLRKREFCVLGLAEGKAWVKEIDLSHDNYLVIDETDLRRVA